MERQINISDALFKRLESHAKGFDTPDCVISRLLDFYENNTPGEYSSHETQIQSVATDSQPTIVFSPEDEDIFKAQLIKNKVARIILHKTDGTRTTKIWRIKNFSESSSLRGNLLSGYLRGWRDKKICKAELFVDK